MFPSGYQANLGLLSALMGPRDRVVSDRLNHASIIDGIRLSGARKIIHPHRDLEAVRTALATPHPRGRTFLVTESLFSMDGDIAPLDQYADLAEEWGADLIVDDSHATGLFGAGRGSGLTEHFGMEKRAAAIVSGCGKGLGVAGAFVAGPRAVIEYMVNVCRSFIFTTLHARRFCFTPWRRHWRSSEAMRSAGNGSWNSPGACAGSWDLRVWTPWTARAPSCRSSWGKIAVLSPSPDGFGSREWTWRALRPPTVPSGTARLPDLGSRQPFSRAVGPALPDSG